MRDLVFKGFLATQRDHGLALAEDSDRLDLRPFRGDPPTHYIAFYSCDGLAKNADDDVVIQGEWAIGIHFPEDYLRAPVEVPRVLNYLGPHPRPWHPNILAPFVCLLVTTGMPLTEILFGLFDLLTWNLFATSDEGLNHAASQWARHQDSSRFPVDRRPLRTRRKPAPRFPQSPAQGGPL